MANASTVLVPTFSLPQEPTAPPPGPAAGPATGPAGQTPSGTTSAPGTPEGGAPTGQPDMCGTQPMLMMALFVGLMWLMVMRPEQKRRKEMQSMLSALKQGDTVVTIGGMHGKVATITDKTIVLKVDQQMLTFDRSAVARVVRDDAGSKT